MKFHGLKYTLANEDNRIERLALPHNCRSVFSIAGSGTRVVSLLAKHPRQIVVLDCSEEQLHFTEFRLALLRNVDLVEYKELMGFSQTSNLESRLTQVVSGLDVSPQAKNFILSRVGIEKDAPIYWGQWEKTFRKLSKPIRTILGTKILTDMQDGLTLREACEKRGSSGRLRFDTVLALFANRAWFSLLMYGRTFPVLNLAESDRQFYERLIDRAFAAASLKDNFFLQLLFFGELRSESALPDEVEASVFRQAKAGAETCDVEFIRSDVLNPQIWEDRSFDAVFLSDVPSYFTALAMQRQISLIQNSISPTGMGLLRFYRHRPIWTSTSLDSRDLNPSEEKTGAYQCEFLYRKRYEDLSEREIEGVSYETVQGGVGSWNDGVVGNER